MAGNAIVGLAGLPELLKGLANAAGELDKEFAQDAIVSLKKYAEVLPVLKEQLGDKFDADLAMRILELLIPKSLRVAFAEVLVRGDVSVRQDMEVEAGLKVGFAPYVSLSAAGSYHKATSEQWGSEVRVTLAALTPDNALLADFVRRAQEREAKDPNELKFLESAYPIILEIFGSDAEPTPVVTDPVDND
jgi:hypothetical protein